MLPTPTVNSAVEAVRWRYLRGLACTLRAWRGETRVSFSTLMAVGLSALMALAVGSVLLVAVIEGRASTMTLAAERANRTLERVNQAVDQIVDPVRQQMAYLTAAVAEGRIDPRDREQLAGMLVSSLSARPQLAGVGFLTNGGVATRVTRSEIRVRREQLTNLSEVRTWLAEVSRTRAPLWQSPTWSNVLQQSVLTLRIPVFDANDQLLGALEAVVSVADLSAQLGQLAGEAGQTPYILYDGDFVLAHPALARMNNPLGPDKPLMSLTDINDPVLAALMATPSRTQDEARVSIPTGAQGREAEVGDVNYRTLFRPLYRFGERPWIIGVYFVGSLVTDQLHRVAMAAVAGFSVLILSVGLAFWLGRRIAGPVAVFAAASDKVRSGDLTAVPRVKGSVIREFDSAARAFNEMVAGMRERERIRDLFGKYVAPEVAERLIREPQRLTLGGERREVSLLFTDITGFTSLSETHEPEVVVPLLNRYLEEVCRLIAQNGGVVVDFIGDAVFALFGAPEALDNHAKSALAAARAIAAFGESFATGAQARGLPFGATRIGVHSGVAVVGNFGSEERMKYGAAGDVVNTASRLEKVNKLFGSRIACSVETIRLAGEMDQARPLGLVMLRGRQAALEVWEPLRPGVTDPWQDEWRGAFQAMRCGDPETEARIRRLAGQRPQDRAAELLLEHVARGLCPPVIDAEDGSVRRL